MARRNAEILRDMYETFNRGDPEAATAALHPEAELHQLPGMPDADSYYGREEFVRGIARWTGEWERPRFEPHEIAEAGDRVIMRVRLSGRGRASGVVGGAELFHVWSLRDGMPHTCIVRSTRAEALQAAG